MGSDPDWVLGVEEEAVGHVASLFHFLAKDGTSDDYELRMSGEIEEKGKSGREQRGNGVRKGGRNGSGKGGNDRKGRLSVGDR